MWDEASGSYLDPATGEVLPTWDQALDAIGPDDEPLHVARFGAKFDAQGVLAGSKDAGRCIRYLTKYLTKHVADCHQADTDAQRRTPTGSPTRCVRAVLADLRQLAALRHPAQERHARPGPRRVQGQGTPAPSTSATPGAGSWSPASGRARPWPTIGATAKPGCWTPSACRTADERRYTWHVVTPADPDYLPPAGGCCTSSPTAPDGKPRSPKPGEEPRKQPAIFRQPGGQRDHAARWRSTKRGNASALADRYRGR